MGAFIKLNRSGEEDDHNDTHPLSPTLATGAVPGGVDAPTDLVEYAMFRRQESAPSKGDFYSSI